jgi:hypothetical protein
MTPLMASKHPVLESELEEEDKDRAKKSNQNKEYMTSNFQVLQKAQQNYCVSEHLTPCPFQSVLMIKM